MEHEDTRHIVWLSENKLIEMLRYTAENGIGIVRDFSNLERELFCEVVILFCMDILKKIPKNNLILSQMNDIEACMVANDVAIKLLDRLDRLIQIDEGHRIAFVVRVIENQLIDLCRSQKKHPHTVSINQEGSQWADSYSLEEFYTRHETVRTTCALAFRELSFPELFFFFAITVDEYKPRHLAHKIISEGIIPVYEEVMSDVSLILELDEQYIPRESLEKWKAKTDALTVNDEKKLAHIISVCCNSAKKYLRDNYNRPVSMNTRMI